MLCPQRGSLCSAPLSAVFTCVKLQIDNSSAEDQVVMRKGKRGGGLKILINVHPAVQDTEIQISCSQLTPEIEKMIATLRILNQQLMVTKGDEVHVLDVWEIIYVEAVDRKTFVYTREEVYESKLKLYEMEERLMECGFFRVSKSCLVQIRNIRVLKNDVNRKLRLTMESGEQIMVSRQYADEIKTRLGIKV